MFLFIYLFIESTSTAMNKYIILLIIVLYIELKQEIKIIHSSLINTCIYMRKLSILSLYISLQLLNLLGTLLPVTKTGAFNTKHRIRLKSHQNKSIENDIILCQFLTVKK